VRDLAEDGREAERAAEVAQGAGKIENSKSQKIINNNEVKKWTG
jgi:hypothetical protein